MFQKGLKLTLKDEFDVAPQGVNQRLHVDEL